MLKLNGKSVSPGIAAAEAHVYNPGDHIVPQRSIGEKECDTEFRRLHRSIQATRKQLKDIAGNLKEAMGDDSALIIGTQSQLLDEGNLVAEIEKTIRADNINTEWALTRIEDKYTKIFKRIQDPTFRERVNDISDLLRRLQRNLRRNKDEATPTLNNVILVARDIAPSEAAYLMSRGNLKGMILSEGGETSHTVILARTLEIPAVMNVEQAHTRIRSGDALIVDGLSGEVLVNPDQRTRKSYHIKQEKYAGYMERSRQVLTLPDRTLDGHDFTLSANIELPMEVDLLQSYGSVGIGLFRTEFLLTDPAVARSEEEQFQIYRNLARRVYPKPLILRTFDVGRDKQYGTVAHHPEPNPALGTMAVRLFLKAPELFRIQIKAALRANESGNLRILFPMVTEIEEIHSIRRILDECRKELVNEGRNNLRETPLGIMIEIPGAVHLIPHLESAVDFLSVGTNDLIQYLLAVDRNNPSVSHLYNPFHPSVIHNLQEISSSAAAINKEINVCGELAGQGFTALMLLGMGYTHFSMNPVSIIEIKRLFTHIHHKFLCRVVRKLTAFPSRSDAEEYFIEQMVGKYPDLFTKQSLF